MKAGKLRHSVTLQEPIVTQNAYNEPVESWRNVATISASVSPLTAREFFNSQQVQSDITHKVELRFYPGVTSKMRLSFDGRLLNIISVINPDERGISLELLCKETV